MSVQLDDLAPARRLPQFDQFADSARSQPPVATERDSLSARVALQHTGQETRQLVASALQIRRLGLDLPAGGHLPQMVALPPCGQQVLTVGAERGAVGAGSGHFGVQHRERIHHVGRQAGTARAAARRGHDAGGCGQGRHVQACRDQRPNLLAGGEVPQAESGSLANQDQGLGRRGIQCADPVLRLMARHRWIGAVVGVRHLDQAQFARGCRVEACDLLAPRHDQGAPIARKAHDHGHHFAGHRRQDERLHLRGGRVPQRGRAVGAAQGDQRLDPARRDGRGGPASGATETADNLSGCKVPPSGAAVAHRRQHGTAARHHHNLAHFGHACLELRLFPRGGVAQHRRAALGVSQH